MRQYLPAIVLFLGGVLSFPIFGASNLPDSAAALYRRQHYREAMLIYSQLLETHPRDFNYSYYKGMCLYYLNERANDAYSLLKLASTRYVPSDVYLGLGQTCMRLYRFDEALEAFGRYEQFGKTPVGELIDAKRLKEMAMEAKRRTTRLRTPRILAKDTIVMDSLPFVLHRKWPLINWTLRVDELLTDYEHERYDLNQVMFFTETPRAKIYFSGAGERKQGDEIWYTSKLANGNWVAPKHTGLIINTPYHEGFAWFDEGLSTLYFTSQGHSSIGGYDVFTSRYDKVRDTWSLPVPMDFPVNSTDNELALFSLPDTSMVLVTDRGCPSGTLLLVHFALSGPAIEMLQLTPVSLWELSRLMPAPASNTLPLQATPQMAAPVIYAEPVSHQADKTLPDEYQKVLARAMQQQTLADSLRHRLNGLEQAAKKETINHKKLELLEQVKSVEGVMKTAEEQANGLFARARTLETQMSSPVPATSSGLGGDTNSAYGGSEPELVPRLPQNEFAIHTHTPYGADRPIPASPPYGAGLLYRIQLGAFRNAVQPDRFGGLSPVDGELDPGNGVTRYFAGFFYDYASAADALSQTHTMGQTGAFIVAFFNGKPVSVKRAREIEEGR